jgi:hypothetical protein
MNSLLQIIYERGTKEYPLRLTKAEIEAFLAWRTPLDKRLEELPAVEQEAFIRKCREECAVKFPRYFHDACVEIVD